MKIGNKTVDFVDTHLTTGASKTTGEQFQQLSAYIAQRKQLGHEVILTADFNTHLERTAAEDPGDAPALAGWAGLQQQVTDSYSTAKRVEVIGLDGRVLTPTEAAAKLKQAGLSDRERNILKRISIGATLEHGGSRIDAVLSTGGFKAETVSIDQQNSASDHEPIVATLRLI